MTAALFDPGLQPERTLLAWRRTCLSVAAGALIVMRFTVGDLGSLTIVAALSGVALAGIAYIDSARRYRRVHRNLVGGGSMPSPGPAIALASFSTTTLALACMVWLVAVNR